METQTKGKRQDDGWEQTQRKTCTDMVGDRTKTNTNIHLKHTQTCKNMPASARKKQRWQMTSRKWQKEKVWGGKKNKQTTKGPHTVIKNIRTHTQRERQHISQKASRGPVCGGIHCDTHKQFTVPKNNRLKGQINDTHKYRNTETIYYC